MKRNSSRRSPNCSRSQSLSRSRSPHSASQSPEIYFEYTETEESPEKFDLSPREGLTPEQKLKTRVITTPTHFEPREKPTASPVNTEDGFAVLEEFLILKDSNPIAAQTSDGENDYELLNLSAFLGFKQEDAEMNPTQESIQSDTLIEMGLLRSVTPPENAIDKRSTSEDDSSIHFLTVPEDDASMEADHQEPQMLHHAAEQPSRSETVSTLEQEQEPSFTRQKTSVDRNNNDANFHQELMDLYAEMDSIMKNKVKAISPDLRSIYAERERIDADIKTLNKLIARKEDEHNRLLHLRCVKEELRGRLDRKRIALGIKDFLPPLLSCSTVELQEIASMLLKEEKAPIPVRNEPSATTKESKTVKVMKRVLEQNLNSPNRNSLPGRQRDMEKDPPGNPREQSSEMPPAKKRSIVYESMLKPLYNSSPLVNRQTLGHPFFDFFDSSCRYDDDLSRTNVAQSQFHNDSKNATMNGTAVKSCGCCGSPEEGFKCIRCRDQSYCSLDCQLRDWNSHWERCGK